MKESGAQLFNQGRSDATPLVGAPPLTRIDFSKNQKREDDADDSGERLQMQHPTRAKAVVHPTIRRGHVDDRNISEGRELVEAAPRPRT